MYAIIRTGGKQYRVQPGERVRVEKLDQKLGSEFDLQDVLFVGGQETFVGNPTVANARVSVVVVRQDKDRKVFVFKKKRRHSYRRLKGHRQLFTELFVKSITAPNGDMAKAETKPLVVDPAKKAERIATWKDKMTSEASGSPVKRKKLPKKTKMKAAPKSKKTKASGKGKPRNKPKKSLSKKAKRK